MADAASRVLLQSEVFEDKVREAWSRNQAVNGGRNTDERMEKTQESWLTALMQYMAR